MTTRRPVSWFLSEKGRTFSFAVITGTGLACTVAKFGPHTFFLEKYKSFVHYYNNGQPAPLSKELSNRYSKCLDLLKIADVQRKLIVPFSVFGFDLFHAGESNDTSQAEIHQAVEATECAKEIYIHSKNINLLLAQSGSTNSRFGVAVGIPVNFNYKSLADLEKDDIEVNHKKVEWKSEAGKKLADALILPDKVQEFAICREIMMTQNNKVIYEATYPFTCIFMAYNISQIINRKYNLYAAPPIMRGILYTIVGMFATGTYFLMKDMTEVYYETETDRRLCELGPEYIESGKVFYEKILKRNQALRELMGSEGEKKYSKMGNENFALRQPRTALVHRKQYFENKLKELSQSIDQISESIA